MQKGKLLALLMVLVLTLGVAPFYVFGDVHIVSETYEQQQHPKTSQGALIPLIDAEMLTVYISFEGFSLGHGFYIEPLAVTLPKGSTAMDATSTLLTQKGHAYSLTWGLDRIQNIHPGIPANPPSFITVPVGYGAGDGSIGSFDYTTESGWINTVNHRMLEVGADTFILSPYDVIRWQFSIEGWGADLGLGMDRGFWTDPLYHHADKTELIRALFVPGIHPDARQAALDVIINPLATEEEVAELVELLPTGNQPPDINPPDDDQHIPPAFNDALIDALTFIRTNTPTPQVGIIGGEWAIIAMARMGVVDEAWFNSYSEHVQNLLLSRTNLGTWFDYQRVVLALTALGYDATNFHGTNLTAQFSNFVPASERPVHSRTINADIFALIALNSGPYSGGQLDYVASIVNAHLGTGWGLGSVADIDTTSMAITALAPYYNRLEVRLVVDSALEWLKDQNPTNPESIAQIVVALSSLGHSFGDDASYYVDMLLTHVDHSTGGFIRGGVVNQMATEQAAYAMVAYWRLRSGHNSLFNMSDPMGTLPPLFLTPETLPPSGGGTTPPPPGDNATTNRAFIRVIDPNPSGQPRVFLSGLWLNFHSGETVFDLLQRTGLNITHRGNPPYVESIGGLFEFDEGPLSGWKFSVNGVFPGGSAASVPLNNNDRVEWLFTRDLGNDLIGVAAGTAQLQNQEPDTSVLDEAIAVSAAYVLRAMPGINTVGSEWGIIGLAKSETRIRSSFFVNYNREVQRHVRANDGIYPTCPTEYSRVIFALNTIGRNPRNVARHNLVSRLDNYEWVLSQGLNGAMWALIALDSGEFSSTAREIYIAEILDKQLPDGGWCIEYEYSNIDITGMALKALAPHQYRDDVNDSIEHALEFLSENKDSAGGFNYNLESAVQVAVALSSLGICLDDERFVYNNMSILDNILSFQNENGSFNHSQEDSNSNLMSSKQGLYGLVSIRRSI